MRTTLSLIMAAFAFTNEANAVISSPNIHRTQSVNETEHDVFGSQMTVKGDHADHTTHPDGRFKHPFLHAPREVEHIYYPDQKTFSVRLQKTKGKSKYHKERANSDRAILTRPGRYNSPYQQTWHMVKQMFFGYQAQNFYDKALYNHYDFFYVGKIYMGDQL